MQWWVQRHGDESVAVSESVDERAGDQRAAKAAHLHATVGVRPNIDPKATLIAGADAILASNTSSIPIAQTAS